MTELRLPQPEELTDKEKDDANTEEEADATEVKTQSTVDFFREAEVRRFITEKGC